jgi:hypothetical protein
MDFLKYKSRNSIYNSYKSKYLGIHLTKEVKDYYNETLIKEVEEDTHTHTHTQWRNIPFSWIGRINIVKMSILLKVIHRFNIIFIKIPMMFSTKLKKKS